jgi:hypothetical protein
MFISSHLTVNVTYRTQHVYQDHGTITIYGTLVKVIRVLPPHKISTLHKLD